MNRCCGNKTWPDLLYLWMYKALWWNRKDCRAICVCVCVCACVHFNFYICVPVHINVLSTDSLVKSHYVCKPGCLSISVSRALLCILNIIIIISVYLWKSYICPDSGRAAFLVWVFFLSCAWYHCQSAAVVLCLGRNYLTRLRKSP